MQCVTDFFLLAGRSTFKLLSISESLTANTTDQNGVIGSITLSISQYHSVTITPHSGNRITNQLKSFSYSTCSNSRIFKFHRTFAVLGMLDTGINSPPRVEKNPDFFKKKPTCFLFFFQKNPFFVFLKKKQDFVLFLRKMEKPYS